MSENWVFVPNSHRHRKHDGSPYNESLDFGVHNCHTHSQYIYIYTHIYTIYIYVHIYIYMNPLDPGHLT